MRNVERDEEQRDRPGEIKTEESQEGRFKGVVGERKRG